MLAGVGREGVCVSLAHDAAHAPRTHVLLFLRNAVCLLAACAATLPAKMFSEDDIMEWFVQICMALCYLHKKRWMHRDLKPHNVFLTGHRRIVKVRVGEVGRSSCSRTHARRVAAA